MKTIIFAIFLVCLSFSCTKVDPNPEKRDQIYIDLGAELEIASKNIESAQKSLESLNNELKKAVPQTGQIKFATQKVRNAETTLQEMTQRKIYFDIKRERRKSYVQFRYNESLRPGGRPWPDVKELEEYKLLTKFNRDKLEWDKNKGVKKDVPRGTNVESSEQK